jgi:hypothetical protein
MYAQKKKLHYVVCNFVRKIKDEKYKIIKDEL